MYKEGFVERGYDKSDRRPVAVGPTGIGIKIAKDIKAFRDRCFDSIKDKVKDNGGEEMIPSLETLIDAFGSFGS
jgi:DNA-binding MarR family transcriptional regulator